MYRSRLAAVLVVAFLAACGGTPSEPAPAPSSPTSGSEVAIDWNNRPSEPIDLGDGISVAGCPGDGPFLCAFDLDGPLGSIELLRFEADSTQVGNDQLASIIADDFDSFAEDRKVGCPEGHTTRSAATEPTTVAGGDGMRSGYEVRNGDGEVVELYVKYWLLEGSTAYLVAAEGHREGSCVGGTEGSFSVDGLDRIQAQLAKVAAGSTF